METNVLKFKDDIKALIKKTKETGEAGEWMHPMYCAYYMLKHKVENKEEFIEEDIKKSHKSLKEPYIQHLFKEKVNTIYSKYAKEIVCTD